MSIVTLVSGGLDSTLMAVLARDTGVVQYPLFIDYGQRALRKELATCRRSMKRFDVPKPKVASLGGFGLLVKSGLTDPSLPIMEAAFTPCRNLLFLLTGAAYGYTVGAEGIAIGLLHESSSLFPDQTSHFLKSAEAVLGECLGRSIRVLAPLSEFTKRDVVRLAEEKGISGTYSCHAGTSPPCGVCISCKEFQFKEN